MLFISAQDDEVITWSPELKLSWNDFRAEPTDNNAAAVTASGITYRFSAKGLDDEVEVDFTIIAHFYPNKSWYRPKRSNSEVLKHEQLHFDITEIFAREMGKRMRAATFTANVRNEVKKIYNQINKELKNFQNTYDSETNFSRDKEQQGLWKKKIEKLLDIG